MKINFYHFVKDEPEYINNLKQLSHALLVLKTLVPDNIEAKLIKLGNVASKELADFIKNENADLNIFCNDILSEKFAIKAASYLDVAAITRVESFEQDSTLIALKNIYQEHMIQKIDLSSVPFGIVTLSKIFPTDESLLINDIPSENWGKSFVTRRYQTYESIVKQVDSSISDAKIVFIGGRGLSNKENYGRLKVLAAKLGAVCACTRAAAMSDFDSYDNVVGISGNILKADLCVTFGVSGAGPLIYGIKNVKKIIAINTDENALIFDHADYGIIDDCSNVISSIENFLS